MAAFSIVRARQLQTGWIEERGLLEPTPEPEAAESYRAPPAPVAEPLLSDEDGQKLHNLRIAVWVLATVPAAIVALVGTGRSPWPMSWYMAATMAASALFVFLVMWWPNATKKILIAAAVVLGLGIAASLAAGVVTEGSVRMIGGYASVGAIVVLAVWLRNKLGGGGSGFSGGYGGGYGGGYSSYSSGSSSSCGGGSGCGGCGG